MISYAVFCLKKKKKKTLAHASRVPTPYNLFRTTSKSDTSAPLLYNSRIVDGTMLLVYLLYKVDDCIF